MSFIWKVLIVIALFAACIAAALLILSAKDAPERITYGMSFNTLYANELGLDWKLVYEAIIGELGVRHLRLAAHWPMVEPINDVYNFAELDYQIARAEEVGAEVILAVGRRLPRWPECHVPQWAAELEWEKQKEEITEYMTVVMNRYKNSSAITTWQIENEPYLEVFATQHCGLLDEGFLEEEIALAKTIDSTRPILVTDSGNLGTWAGAYKNGDQFGTSVYIYFWNPELGQFRTAIPAWFYRAKESIMELLYGQKETMLIELSAEPWLLEPIVDTDIETQYSRMNLEKFNDILEYAKDTRYQRQYLWGAEWWYWLSKRGHPEMWERGLELFNSTDAQ